ncbi:MAG: hypothetical protein ACOYB4_04050, partial [Methyloceanibacter sp.]
AAQPEGRMARLTSCFRGLPAALGAAALAAGLCLAGMSEQANAAPVFIPGLDNRASTVEPVRDIQRWQPPIYKRGRTPRYPYYYRGPGPRGWEVYMGFVPYEKGDYGTQALQRSQYPDSMAWPPGMDVWQEPGEPQPKLRPKRRR